MIENNFYKTREGRKYVSIVDEYRRFYVTGKKIKIAKAVNRGDEIFEVTVSKFLRELKMKKAKYETIYSGMKLGNLKYKFRLKISKFVNNREFILEYYDNKNNLYRIIIQSKSNKSNKISYQEWIKKNKTFFGMNDLMSKFFFRKGVNRKIKLIKKYLERVLLGINRPNYKFENEIRDYDKSPRINRGFIQRRELNYETDLANKYQNSAAPDEIWVDKDVLTRKGRNND